MLMTLRWAICGAVVFTISTPFFHAANAQRQATPPAALPSSPTAHRPILPLPPEELLRFLPSPPREWKLTESRASSIFMGWMRSEATRQFLFQPPPAGGPDAPSSPPPPQTTRVRVYDTGYFPAFSGDFEYFAPGRYGPRGESFFLGSLPAHRYPLGGSQDGDGDAGERLRVSVRRRFIVEIDTRNQPPKAGLTWLQTVDLTRLQQVPDTGADRLPRPVVQVQIDELNPGNNRSLQSYWMDDDRGEKAGAAGPP